MSSCIFPRLLKRNPTEREALPITIHVLMALEAASFLSITCIANESALVSHIRVTLAGLEPTYVVQATL